MHCNSFVKKLFIFWLTFAAGILASDLLDLSELQNQKSVQVEAEIARKDVFAENKIKQGTKQNCVWIDTELSKPFKSEQLNQYYAELIKEKTEMQIWLERNPNSSKSEKENRQEKVLLIEGQIKVLQELDKYTKDDEYGLNQKLLYVEKCYEF